MHLHTCILYCQFTDYGLVLAVITVDPDGPVPYRQVRKRRIDSLPHIVVWYACELKFVFPCRCTNQF